MGSRRWALSRGLCACAVFAASCASGPRLCREDPVTGSETQCAATSGDPAEAAVTAGIAAGAWGVVGCTVNGCEPPYRCNHESKQCERIRCDENESSCPPGYMCDPIKHVCL
jgi:hypothetical protein